MDRMGEQEDRGLRFLDAYAEEGRLFFSARNFNGLFCLKAGESEAELLGHFAGEEFLQQNLHRQVICVGRQLYFIPYTGRGMGIYDMDGGTFSFVEIKEGCSASRAFLMGTKILMVPFEQKIPFLLFHTENDTYEVLDSLWKDIRRRLSVQGAFIWGLYSSWVLGKRLFLKGAQGTILCVDMESWELRAYEIPGKYELRNLYLDGREFYITISDQARVVRWNVDTGDWREYVIKTDDKERYHPYMTVVRWGEHLLLLPDQAGEIRELDEEAGEWRVKDAYMPEGFYRKRRRGSFFAGYRSVAGELLLFPWSGNGLLTLSDNGSEWREVRYPADRAEILLKERKKRIVGQAMLGQSLYENDETGIDLKNLISALPCLLDRGNVGENQNAGRKIWDFCQRI